jgi:hypothetical protein
MVLIVQRGIQVDTSFWRPAVSMRMVGEGRWRLCIEVDLPYMTETITLYWQHVAKPVDGTTVHVYMDEVLEDAHRCSTSPGSDTMPSKRSSTHKEKRHVTKGA